jgi:hypothetical protein
LESRPQEEIRQDIDLPTPYTRVARALLKIGEFIVGYQNKYTIKSTDSPDSIKEIYH